MSRPRPATPPRPSGPPPGAEPATVRPRRFDQAQELADKFKDGQSVILNLESAERDVARRLIDFASGVCYSLDGSMEKIAPLLDLELVEERRFDSGAVHLCYRTR